jgi:hypothetical protein
MIEYIPLIITAIVSIITSGVITRLLTIKQERRKIDSEINKLESDVIVSYGDVYQRLYETLKSELDRKDSDCSDRIDRLCNEYEDRITKMQSIHEEEIAILESKIDDLMARVAELELERIKQ